MDYRDTLNLPKTEFPMKANLVKREPEILKFWDEIGIYNAIQEKNAGKPKYILHDGPPYANGHIHMGHALNKILKDIIVKYKAMSGFDAPYIPGWDCHGMPIEHKVMKNIGNAKDKLSIPEIRQRCREYANKFINIQREEFKRLGVFGDWNAPYLTMSPEYSAGVIEVFEELVVKGYVYKSNKPVFWCRVCTTALAEAEVEYMDKTSPSVYVKFPLIDDENTFVLIWTTTPWTLPGNVAIALHPEFKYVKIQINAQERLLLGKDLLEMTMEKAGVNTYKIIEEYYGHELEGKNCKHPFIDRESVLILAEYVTREQGTGCVHTAPGHGIEDYSSGMKYKLPIITPVDERGYFTEEAGEFVGEEVFKANEAIIQRLRELDALFFTESVIHSYPHCWRCKQPIIFRATPQWFINLDTQQLRERVLKEIDKVSWIPAWGRDRFYNTVKARTDWCISRQRAWGVPIPAIYCNNCGEYMLTDKIIRFVKEIIRKYGADAWFTKDITELIPKDTRCTKCNSTNLRKESDILDVWFESGSSHRGVLTQRQELRYPADLYLEGSDQHRGWFQSSMLTACATQGKPPYRGVLTHGFMVDATGKAMHKSAGNVIAPEEILQKYGADVLRLWVASEDYRQDVRLSDEILQRMAESYKKIRNTWRFMLGNLADFSEDNKVEYDSLHHVDKWILHRLQMVIQKAEEAYSNFEFHHIYHLLVNFCTVDLSAVYLDIIKDRLYTHGKNSLSRRATQIVLKEILSTIVPLSAPILSFTCEEIWQYFDWKDTDSVFLTEFPQINTQYINEDLAIAWDRILQIREIVTGELEKFRVKGLIGSSLEAEIILDLPPNDKKLFEEYAGDIATLFIVSYATIRQNDKDIIVTVQKARGKKCIRCWCYHEDVGKNTLYPELCPKCVSVIAEYC